MLKKRDLQEVPILFELMSHPEVFPYVRHKATTLDEYYFLTKQMIEAEEQGELISRTILDEYHQPIGTINLFDMDQQSGFLATWIGKPYFGKGYNRYAKELFFETVFFHSIVETIFMKVRKANTRSLKAVLKLPYASLGNAIYPDIYAKINRDNPVYDLFAISKEHYLSYYKFTDQETSTDGEVV